MRIRGARIAGIVAILVLLSPLVIIVIMSFDGTGYLEFPPRALSLSPYVSILGSSSWRAAFGESLQAALIATSLAVVCGVLAALGLDRLSRGVRRVLLTLILIPLIIPEIVLAVGQDLSFSRIGLGGTIVGIGVGQSILGFPLVVILVLSGLGGVGRNLEDAAASLGAGRVERLVRVVLPSLKSSIAAGALFAFLASFDDLLIALFLSGIGTNTVPVRLWSSIEFEASPSIAAVSTLIMLFATVIIAFGITARYKSQGVGRRERRKLVGASVMRKGSDLEEFADVREYDGEPL